MTNDQFDTGNYTYTAKLLFIGIDLYVCELRLFIPFYITRESHEARMERISQLIDRLNERYEAAFAEAKKTRKPAAKRSTKNVKTAAKKTAKKPAAKKPVTKKPAVKKTVKKK